MQIARFVPIALMLAACAHTEQKKAEPAAPPTASVPKPTEATCSSDADCGDKHLCIRNRCVEISDDVAECSRVAVHFDLNVSELGGTETPKLERSARCLKADHALHVTIEGNADERGTEEYNLALGDRRANTVEKYLERLGVSPSQLKTVSYGKENPLCTEHDEACWAQNRRADLGLASNKEGVAKRKKK